MVGLVALINASPASAAPADITDRYITNHGTGLELSANFGDGTTGSVYTVAPSTSIYHNWYIVDGVNEFINIGTGQCLSSNFGNGSSGNVYAVACSGVIYQKWQRITTNVDGGVYFQIKNAGTGWCLSSNFGDGTTGSVYTVPCSSSVYHDWAITVK
jgi:hypothetical protein